MYTAHFNDAACADTRQVGGKAAGLAHMTANDLPVAPGFAINAAAYREYLGQDGLGDYVHELTDTVLSSHDQARYDEVEALLHERFAATPLPDAVAEEVRAAYRALCEEVGVPDVAVAVRSSATAEDSVQASFAGEFETWVDVVGEDSVIEHVMRCYDSVYSGRVLAYLDHQGIHPREVEMAVVVQKTVRAKSAGVMFTLSPTSGDRSKVVIEANWGLGLSVVGGEATPDRFVVEKIGGDIIQRTLGTKEVQYLRGDEAVPVPEDQRDVPCLTDGEIADLTALGKRLERLHGGAAQDIEFALDRDLAAGRNVVLLQCRPETVWSSKERKPVFDASAGMMSWITGAISGVPTGLGAADPHHQVGEEHRH